jgi:hypothetical protein
MPGEVPPDTRCAEIRPAVFGRYKRAFRPERPDRAGDEVSWQCVPPPAQDFDAACRRLRQPSPVEENITLTDIVAEQSVRNAAKAVKFIAQLKASGRYQADVY